ncbi:hypothetical protein EDB86DRAFT_618640 [Lactarius hatsudake]|nr:hypothetical protein EDB86DRAFT_618640 [Lactarius hatsudake]
MKLTCIFLCAYPTAALHHRQLSTAIRDTDIRQCNPCRRTREATRRQVTLDVTQDERFNASELLVPAGRFAIARSVTKRHTINLRTRRTLWRLGLVEPKTA